MRFLAYPAVIAGRLNLAMISVNRVRAPGEFGVAPRIEAEAGGEAGACS